jgi:hypothetical protein
MKLTLFVVSGPKSGEVIAIAPGEGMRIGSSPEFCQKSFPGDPRMSAVHFVLESDAAGWNVRDLNSRQGTLVNRVRVAFAALKEADRITAGETTFLVRLGNLTESEVEATSAAGENYVGTAGGGGAAPVAAEADKEAAKEEETEKLPAPLAKLEKTLSEYPLPLFALLDQACDPSIQEMLSDLRAEAYPLFDIDSNPQLAPVTPMLVAIEKNKKLLNAVLAKGWGNNWGFFCASSAAPYEMRTHFKKFLRAQDEDGKEMFFRYYDPRVLRLYLPTCTAQESTAFFGSAQWFLMEDEDPKSALAFFFAPQGVSKRKLELESEEVVEITPSPARAPKRSETRNR